ncbi:MAG: AAA family ATPase [Actinomycetota bacterium]
MATLHMLCGLPGSGKSTLAKRLEIDRGVVRLTPDEWILRLGDQIDDVEMRRAVEGLQWELAQRLLEAGVGVVLEAGFWSRSERDAVRRRVIELGADVQLHHLDVPLDELKDRLRRRNDDQTTEFRVDLEQVDEWALSFEPPTSEELGNSRL